MPLFVRNSKEFKTCLMTFQIKFSLILSEFLVLAFISVLRSALGCSNNQ